MRIYVKLVDEQRVTAKFNRLPASLLAAMVKKAEQLRVRLRRYVIDSKLSGQVLNRKTGRLQRNVRTKVLSSPTKVVIQLWNISRYARIHEDGGMIPAHIIKPKRTQVLAWTKMGAVVFAKKVDMPTVMMPKRSFMATALKEMSVEMTLELKRSIIEDLKKK